MKNKDFIFWLKGFVTACNSHMPTPAQWDALKDKLDEVDSIDDSHVYSGMGSNGILNFEGRNDITRNIEWTTNTSYFSDEEKIF